MDDLQISSVEKRQAVLEKQKEKRQAKKAEIFYLNKQ